MSDDPQLVAATDALIERDRVQLPTDSGPYERDLDAGAR